MNTRTFNTNMLNDPFFIGFDRMLDRMTSTTLPTTSPKYPPYNVVKLDDDRYELQLAIAGFDYDDLDISRKLGVLTIAGNKDTDDDKNYLHKGISARSFKREFTLMDTIEIHGADLNAGILTVHLENVIPEEKKAQKIEINRSERELLKR
jgi:molecular chaperone IbpA